MSSQAARPAPGRRSGVAVGKIIGHVRALVDGGSLRPGDRLGTQRELARRIGVSRHSVGEGLRLLSALGVVRSRGRAGTHISDARVALSGQVLALPAVLHQIGGDGLLEARQLLEAGAAALAAERASADQLALMSHEVAEMFAQLQDPPAFRLHDRAFHCAVAAGANNRALEWLIETIVSLQAALPLATPADARVQLRETAEVHRRIYRAIRSRDVDAARAAMAQHLERAR